MAKLGRVNWLGAMILVVVLSGLTACGGEVATPTAVVTTVAPTSLPPTALPAPPTALPVPPTATAAPPTPTATPAPTATPVPTPTPVLPATDGRWLAYIARDGNSTLYTGRFDGNRKRKVADNVQDIEWSPDGTRFIFYKKEQTWLAEYDGANPRLLSDTPGYGKWLPTGKYILLPPINLTSRRYSVLDPQNGKPIREFELPETPGFFSSVFDLTPDARNVVYYRVDQKGAVGFGSRPAEYHLLDLDTKQDKVLAANLADGYAVWNADYSEVISQDVKDNTLKAVSLKTGQSRTVLSRSIQSLTRLKRDKAGNRLFWVNPLGTIRLDGSGYQTYDVQALYPSEGVPSYYLSVAGDGSSVIYASTNSKAQGGGVFRLDVANGRISRLADNDFTNPTGELFAGASGDNRLLVFSSRSSQTGAYLVKEADGGKQVGQLEGLPVWQPIIK